MCVIQRNNDDDKVFALLSARILRIADRLGVPLANGKAVLMVQQSRPVALVIFRRESIELRDDQYFVQVEPTDRVTKSADTPKIAIVLYLLE